MKSMKLLCAAGIAAILGVSGVQWDAGVPSFHVLGTSAQAIVGRPLTPYSYAGAARRTARTVVVRRTNVRVNTLPSYCVYGSYYGGRYYNCRGVYYQKSGNTYVRVVIK